MSQAVTDNFEQGNISRLLIEYSIPAIISMTMVAFKSVIASIVVGYGIGPLALTAMAVTFPLANLIMAVCSLVSVGAGTLISIELGRRNQKKAESILGHATILSVLFAFFFCITCLIFLDPILTLFGASSQSLPYARDYMEPVLLTIPIPYLMIGLNNIMRTSGYPRLAMLTSIGTMVLNVGLTPLFVFYFNWGMAGAGWAVPASQFFGLIWVLHHFMKKTSSVHFQKGIYQIHPRTSLQILYVGMPPFLLNVCASVIIIAINYQLNVYGGDLAIAAYGIINRILTICAMVVGGLAMGMQPIIGFNYGAGHHERVNQTLRCGIRYALIFTGTACAIAEFWPAGLVRCFTDDPTLSAYAIRGLRICSLTFITAGPQIVLSQYFQAIGKANFAMGLSLTRQMLLYLPGLFILPLFLGMDGVWASMPTADMLSFLVTLLVFFWWRNQNRETAEDLEKKLD